MARVGPTPDGWADLVGDIVHSLRSALDHLAFALNAKGYADTHNGAAIPPERQTDSSFPIFGLVNQRGMPRDGRRAFGTSSSYRFMPAGAVEAIKKLQPYNRGQEFRRDPLWAIHELSRIDKHRIDLVVTAAPPTQRFNAYFTAVDEAAFGIGGPVYDGKELSYWVVSEGASEPDVDLDFTRGVAFGESTVLRNQPVIASLKGIRNYLRFKVAFPLGKYL